MHKVSVKEITKQFLKFGIVGLFNTMISYVLFIILVSLNTHYLIANFISFLAGVINAYYWSDKYIFNKKENKKRSPIKTMFKTFVSYGFTGIIIQSMLLLLFVEKMGIISFFAQLLSLMVTVPMNFILNKFWSFK